MKTFVVALSCVVLILSGCATTAKYLPIVVVDDPQAIGPATPAPKEGTRNWHWFWQDPCAPEDADCLQRKDEERAQNRENRRGLWWALGGVALCYGLASAFGGGGGSRETPFDPAKPPRCSDYPNCLY